MAEGSADDPRLFVPPIPRLFDTQPNTPRFGAFLLDVDKILRLIACKVVASKGKATAVCSACYSKSFEDPVLDAQRVTQVELSPLFERFLGDVWNKRGYTVSAPMAVFSSFLLV